MEDQSSYTPPPAAPAESRRPVGGRRRVTLELPPEMVEQIDHLRREWGIRARGGVVEELLRHMFSGDRDSNLPLSSEEEQEAEPDESGNRDGPEDPDDASALVLVMGQALATDDVCFALEDERDRSVAPASGGIDLPGFVRRRSDQVRRSLRAPTPGRSPLPRLQPDTVQLALVAAGDHWFQLYGKPPTDTVLEAAMIWLAKDIWPHADPAEGRAFTWTQACLLMAEMVPGWESAAPDFARVIVTAGVLEDPFSGDSLAVRVPTLIRRFVNRFRRRRGGASFQTLENTMTLQGALKLLKIPVAAGQRLTLAQIREAYRQQAMEHHPDSGGSVEEMRRINEAYQLLKELYRTDTATKSSH